MALNYNGFQNIATKLINLFGADVTIRTPDGAVYVTKGVIIGAKGAPLDVQDHPAGTYPDTQFCLVKGDLKHQPQVDDRLIKSGDIFKITTVEQKKPANKTIYYKLGLGK